MEQLESPTQPVEQTGFAALGLPARIRQEDEARAEFERVFQAMDGDDDKAIDIDEWARYLGEREWARHLSKRPLAERRRGLGIAAMSVAGHRYCGDDRSGT